VTRAPRPRVPKGARPVHLGDAQSERLLSMTLALAAEVATLSEELDTVRELLVRRSLAGEQEFSGFVPDETVARRRSARRRAMIDRMLRIVLEDLDGAAGAERGKRYAQLVERISR
jgi:hypothetical protein